MNHWIVYIVRCSDESLYTGITRDVERRVDEHNKSDLLGARYTRARRPVRLVYREIVNSRSEAARRENEIKCLSRKEKESLLVGLKRDIRDSPPDFGTRGSKPL